MAHPPSPESVCAATLGALTFPVVLAGAQLAVFQPLGITLRQGSRVSSICGGLAVLTAGFTASIATAKSLEILQSTIFKSNTEGLNIITSRDVFLSSISSLVVFRALGGRFSNVLPSSLLRPGAFARDWLPTTRGMQYATDKERDMIQTIGRRYGCHSCGKRRVSNFVADHQPPSKTIVGAGEVLSQRFYPQCNRCSRQQGGLLSNNNGKFAALNPKSIRTHSPSLRVYHTFLPLPFVFAYLYRGTKEEEEDVSEQFVEVVVHRQGKEVAVQTRSKRTLHKLIHESDLEELVINFPLRIVWEKIVQFLDSFRNAGDAFHVTLWSFIVIAACGTI